MPWNVKFRAGVHLPQIRWWLDAHFPVERSFVSHAHSDHTALHREVVCSRGTSRLMQVRIPGERREHILEFGQTAPLAPGTTITLHPAGHIFGSAQSLLVHEEHGSLLYTGDFKLRRGLSAEPCATPHAELLIMETTYGRPHYVFPPTAQVLSDIVRFCHQTLEDGETPVLYGYSLGKSQELLSSLAEARLPLMLHPQTVKMTRVYEELGIAFPAYRPFLAEEVAGHVVICPPQAGQSTFLKKIPRKRCAVITGWALDPGAIFRYQCDAAFPLSDHADYDDLLRFVELVKPQRVLTLHGFAAEFARTLRERGIEAWAIGQDNQLEFAIPSARVSTVAPAAVTQVAEDCGGTCESLDQFARVAEQIRETTRKLEKIELLRTYFTSLDAVAMPLAALFFTGRPFPQSDERRLNLGWSAIRRAVLEATGLNEADFRQAYLKYSDSGDTAAALLEGRTRPAPFSLAEFNTLLGELAAARGPLLKIGALRDRLQQLNPAAAKYLIKILTGDLRIGLKEGLVEEAIAVATGQPTELVREANMLCGDLTEVARAAREGGLERIQLRVFNPLQFMLASPEPTASALIERLGTPLWLEEKYDGIRCQLHKQGGRVELYSRDLHRISDQFPDVVRAAGALEKDVIIDGELLAWREGRALPFAELQKRLGRKGGDDFFLGAEIPVSISAYDLLWLAGEPLLRQPLARRRALLESLFPAATRAGLVLAPRSQAQSAVEVEAAFLAARQRGNEGLMAKDPQSTYTPGRRGLAWLKLKKAYATLDVVVVGVEYGHGKRRGVLSDYTFSVRDERTGGLLTVGKAYSGLTDAEIAELTPFFLEHTVQDYGRYRDVEPTLVIEVAFDTIQRSERHQSGFALRFPRILRLRPDKTVAEIDTLDTCRRLAEGAGFNAVATP